MEVNEAIILAKKLALREQSPEEMEAITDFLKTASRAEAESFMEEYHAAIPVNGDFAKADQQLIDRLHGLDLHEKNHYPPTVHRVHFLKRSWFRYAAAAVLLITFVSVAYLWNIQKEKPSATLVKSNPVKTDIPAPTANRATLTLSGGQQILVDNVRDGRLAAEGQVSIEKTTDGRIVYSALSTTKELLYNTLVVPRGSQVASITLADGSRAWLNAESSLKYPVAFVGRERKVEITGEVYFEVSKDPKKKFIVSANGV
ncbi:MAG TPA: FecR family protein, partial [Flavitalea sp.]|nr:FecR family protein [Flavitalea sp.]